MLQPWTVCHETLTSPRGRISRRRLAQVPLPDLAVFGAGEKEVRRRLGDNAFHTVCMAPVDPSIGIAFTQIPHSSKEVVETSTSSRRHERRRGGGVAIAAGVFDVEHSDLGIAGAGNQGAIVRVGHKLDGEDIGLVAREHGRIQRERRSRRLWLVRVDIQVLVVGPRREEAS